MGGFILNVNGDEKKSIDDSSFNKRGQKKSLSSLDLKWQFFKYKKILIDNDYFIFENKDSLVIGSGTISYKGLSVDNGFDSLAKDVVEKNIDNDHLYGHYTLIHIDSSINEINIYFDEAGHGAPFVVPNKLISSSFLACADNVESLELDHDGIFEQIYTGCYFNSKTSFKEIRKISKNENWHIDGLNINFFQIVQSIKEESEFKSSEEAVDYELTYLNKYFKTWKSQVDNFHADLGLSSGYDSRLMLGLFEKNYKNSFQLHSYWKKEKDFDNIVAEKLAAIAKNNLIRVAIQDRNRLSSSEFDQLLDSAMVFYDGLFPVNHGWVREYRTVSHRLKILKNAKFGFSGISGEQYRNDFNLLNHSFSIDYLIKNIVLEDFNDIVLKDSLFYKKGLSIIKKSIVESLNLPKDTNRISRLDIQRYYCEMYVVGGPGIRNRIENNVAFFLSPFTERLVQKKAYKILSYLGCGGAFQARMISKTNPRLAAIISDYGFSFNKIKIKNRFLWFLSAIVGRKTKMRAHAFFKGSSNLYIDSFGTHKKEVQRKLKELKKYNFEFPIESEKFKQDTIDRLIGLSKLLSKYHTKIK